MKKLLAVFLFMVSVFFSLNADAQKVKDWLNAKKQEAKNKVNTKIDQKSSEGLDKVINAPETAVKKKKNKKGTATSADTDDQTAQNIDANGNTQSNNSTPIEVVNDVPSEEGKVVIQTNIKCNDGKKKITTLLKKQAGVSSVDINTTNGEVTLAYNSDASSYSQLIKLINDNGFDADGNIATSKKGNNCN